jgi:hypothetical protein
MRLGGLLFGVTLWPWVYLAVTGYFRGDEPMRGAWLVHRYLYENWMNLQTFLFLLVPYGLITAGRDGYCVNGRTGSISDAPSRG